MLDADPEELRTTAFYWISRALGQLVARVFLRLTVAGAEHVPGQGGALVVANHLSVADPPLLVAICSRPLAFMGKSELFHSPLRAAIFRGWRVFPVRRGEVDVAAVRAALGFLRRGEVVVVFPEGTRRPKGLGAALPGIGYFAVRSGCPVVPVGIEGTQVIKNLWSLRFRPRVRVTFGEPFVVPGGDAEVGATLIMRGIAALLPKERRGQYAVTDTSRGSRFAVWGGHPVPSTD